MILIWRGWGLLAAAALVPLLASCAGLADAEPAWVFMLAVAVSLLVAGVVCVHFGTRWNRPVIEHTFFFLPLQFWGWVYFALVALPALVLSLTGVAFLAGVFTPAGPPKYGPAFVAIGGLTGVAIVVGVGYALIRSTRYTGEPRTPNRDQPFDEQP